MSPVPGFMVCCALLLGLAAGITAAGSNVPATRLFVSNAPERVSAPRILFEGRLRDDGAVRLMYHHLNDGATPLYFVIELLNPDATPVNVQLIDAFINPDGDEMHVGHLAMMRYAEREASNTGSVVTVPAASILAINTARWPARGVVSGLARLNLLTGGRTVIVRLRALAQPSARLAPLANYTPSSALGDSAFISTALNFSGTYTVDDMWLFFSLGDVPIPGEHPGQYLAGAYGVWHNYTMTLINPTARTATVLVTITPAAGAARLIYSFGNGWQYTRTLSAYTEETLTSVTLAPGATRTLHLTAMPQSGSNYPMRLSVHAKN